MKPLVVIPARGGSKGIPRKKIKSLDGKPLIYYTIEAAREVFDDELICVSTDNVEIKEVVERTGLEVPFLRPEELATDAAGMREVLLHAVDYFESTGYDVDTIVSLQPTSPFRKGTHIKEALEMYELALDRVVSVKETDANPYFVLFEENEKGFLEQSKLGNFKRRQDCPKVWELNGAIYVINVESLREKAMPEFKKVRKYEMSQESSLDIDTPLDWELTKLLLKRNR